MTSLESYQSKRHFGRTPEPKGGQSASGRQKARTFVVQKHDARQLHYDFRLELDGVLKSWALPKGPSNDPSEKRLAVRTEDHPLDYADFEGSIPEGEYGAGTVAVWDQGTWEPEDTDDVATAVEKGDFKLTLRGRKLKGSWTLVKMKNRPDHWLLIKHKDRRASTGTQKPLVDRKPRSVKSGRSMKEIAEFSGNRGNDVSPADIAGAVAHKSVPAGLSPMLATLVHRVPKGDDWLHEVKFDGYRVLAIKDRRQVKLITRHRKDWTQRFEAVADTLKSWDVRAVFDGEMVALDERGLGSFQALQKALHEKNTSVIYYIFDLLWWDGHDLRKARLIDRKRALHSLLASVDTLHGSAIRYTEHQKGNGSQFYREACRSGLEGILSKKAGSRYRGSRTQSWRKVKCSHRQAFVIVGFTRPSGSRVGFGALLLGIYDRDRKLRYAGRVGTGFDKATLKELREKLDGLRRKTCPFADLPERANEALWVRPQLVAEVTFTEWTDDGRLRHPSFQGLSEDKKARDIKKDEPHNKEQNP